MWLLFCFLLDLQLKYLLYLNQLTLPNVRIHQSLFISLCWVINMAAYRCCPSCRWLHLELKGRCSRDRFEKGARLCSKTAMGGKVYNPVSIYVASEAPWWKKVARDAENESSKNTLTTWNGNLCLFTNDLKISYF